MNKLEFVAKAPLYYALAIATYLGRVAQKRPAVTINQIDDEMGEFETFLKYEGITDQAISILKNAGVLHIVTDDFGPTLYSPRAFLNDWLDGPACAAYPQFQKFRDTGYSDVWLKEALRRVNELYEELGVSLSDFNSVPLDSEWEPIPLERDDADLAAATEKLDVAIDAIEKDNGYAVHAPAERDFVLSNLKTLSKTLKTEAQIYWMQIKTFGIDPLTQVINRFGEAAIGVAASAAKAAIIDWLKKNFAKIIEWWL